MRWRPDLLDPRAALGACANAARSANRLTRSQNALRRSLQHASSSGATIDMTQSDGSATRNSRGVSSTKSSFCEMGQRVTKVAGLLSICGKNSASKTHHV